MCNYSFVFDAKAKTLLLEADQNIQMHSAMQEAATRGVFFGFPAIQQYLVLEVRRDNLVNDTINELSKCASADLKKPLKVKAPKNNQLMKFRFSNSSLFVGKISWRGS